MADSSKPQDECLIFSSNFIYRGEGNANLVITHLEDKIVIRFCKRSTKEDLPVDRGYFRVIQDVHFAKTVLLNLLNYYVDVPEIVYYNQKILDNLLTSIKDLRPANRLSKSNLEQYATKLPDYTFLSKELYEAFPTSIQNSTNPVFCVEIKPKQGYICEVDNKFSKCPFCLKQFYKVKMSSIVNTSDYCPLDLFSGDEKRMKIAISNLINNPQNNFKLFKNGSCCYNQDSSQSDFFTVVNELFIHNYEESFTTLMVKILLQPFCNLEAKNLSTNNLMNGDKTNVNFKNVRPKLKTRLVEQLSVLLAENCKSCDFKSNSLPEGCVLERILCTQKLHQLGNNIVYAIYDKYSDILCDNLIHNSIINTFDSNKSIDGQQFKQMSPSQNELEILQNFLLFAMAKDCSIMISFQKIDLYDAKVLENPNVIKLSEENNFIVSVKVLDVDLKSIQSINRHYDRDVNVINAAISTLSQKQK